MTSDTLLNTTQVEEVIDDPSQIKDLPHFIQEYL